MVRLLHGGNKGSRLVQCGCRDQQSAVCQSEPLHLTEAGSTLPRTETGLALWIPQEESESHPLLAPSLHSLPAAETWLAPACQRQVLLGWAALGTGLQMQGLHTPTSGCELQCLGQCRGSVGGGTQVAPALSRGAEIVMSITVQLFRTCSE